MIISRHSKKSIWFHCKYTKGVGHTNARPTIQARFLHVIYYKERNGLLYLLLRKQTVTVLRGRVLSLKSSQHVVYCSLDYSLDDVDPYANRQMCIQSCELLLKSLRYKHYFFTIFLPFNFLIHSSSSYEKNAITNFELMTFIYYAFCYMSVV